MRPPRRFVLRPAETPPVPANHNAGGSGRKGEPANDSLESKKAWPPGLTDSSGQPIGASLAPTETSTRAGGVGWGKGEREKQGTRGEVTVGGVDGHPRKPISGQPGKTVRPIRYQFSNRLPNRKSQEAGRAAGAGEGKR